MGPSADAAQLEIFRRMAPQEKLALASELREIHLDMLAAGLRARRSDASEEDIRLEVLKLILGDRLFQAAYTRS